MSILNSLLGSIFNKGKQVPNETVTVPPIVTNINGHIPKKEFNITMTANSDSLADADFDLTYLLHQPRQWRSRGLHFSPAFIPANPADNLPLSLFPFPPFLSLLF